MQRAFTLSVNTHPMSSTTLRHHNVTLSFLPQTRARRIESMRRDVRIRFSRRRVKRMARAFLQRREN